MAQPIDARIQGVRFLLSTVNDYLPDPVTSTGLISRSSLPGPAPGKRVPCGYCRRAGRVRTRQGTRFCPVCDGYGWRTRRGPSKPEHPLYEQPWDEYTAEPVVETGARKAPAMTERQREHELERLAHARALREGDDSSERFGWERERIAYDRQGSYRELRRVLFRLQGRWSYGHRLTSKVYFRGVDTVLSSTDLILLAAAEEWVAREMRGRIRVPPWVAEQAAGQKRRSISDLAAEGMSAGQIARVLRIPKAKVKRLLTRDMLGATAMAVPGESA